jgi:uncharacterized membrane protein YoaK (UPF0700 family)
MSETPSARSERRMIAGLAGFTFATGLVDATSYLGLGHVFTANMTGNIVFLGFALGGEAGFSISASLFALGGFLAGALVGGRVVRSAGDISQARVGFSLEALALVIAAILTTTVSSEKGAARWAILALLGAAMGLQNASVRRLAVTDMNTTVLTLTLTGIAADSRPAGGTNPRLGRRTGSVLLILFGATVGALLERRGIGWPVAVAVALVSAGTVVLMTALPGKAAGPGRTAPEQDH